MNSIIYIFTLIATTTAERPNWKNERSVTGNIVSAIEGIGQAIQDAGLDPLNIDHQKLAYELPVPVIFNTVAALDKLISTGLSNIVIHRVSYSLLTFRLNFDIELPLIHFSVDNAESAVELLGYKFDFKASGKIEVHSIRIVGVVRISVGVITGVSIRSVDVSFTLGDITSDINLSMRGVDYSDQVNKLVGKTIPDTIRAYTDEINELLELLLREMIEANL